MGARFKSQSRVAVRSIEIDEGMYNEGYTSADGVRHPGDVDLYTHLGNDPFDSEMLCGHYKLRKADGKPVFCCLFLNGERDSYDITRWLSPTEINGFVNEF